jgi:CheY-like chemotaxis protein
MVQFNLNNELEQLLTPGILQSKTILIAEDEETNYYLVQEYLEFTKANLLWAQDGKEVIEMAKNNDAIDLILMDIRMPEIDGYEAMKIIKLFKPDIPIVAVTAFAVNGDREKALKMGFIDFISKPISRKILLEVLTKYTI